MSDIRIEVEGGKLHIALDDILHSLTSENVKTLCRSATWDEETVRGILSYMTTGSWPDDNGWYTTRSTAERAVMLIVEQIDEIARYTIKSLLLEVDHLRADNEAYREDRRAYRGAISTRLHDVQRFVRKEFCDDDWDKMPKRLRALCQNDFTGPDYLYGRCGFEPSMSVDEALAKVGLLSKLRPERRP